jgi:hypothetical protein
MRAHFDPVLTPSPRSSGERGFEPEISGLLSPALSSLGGGEGENKDSFKMRPPIRNLNCNRVSIKIKSRITITKPNVKQ